MAGEIEAAEDRANQGHDDVAGQAGGGGREGRADDHGYGEIEHVASCNKIAELSQHVFPFAASACHGGFRGGSLFRLEEKVGPGSGPG